MYSIVIYLYACLYQRLSTHLSVDGHLGYFRCGAMTKKAGINTYGQIFVYPCVFISYM